MNEIKNPNTTTMSTDLSALQPNGPASMTQSFGSTEMVTVNEMATSALAAQARAAVESRYVLALRRPRNIDQVRINLMRECSRPGFAQVARYAKPVGGNKVVGPSIRFAEASMRCMGNLMPETIVTLDDETKRNVRVMLTDLETNLTLSKDIVIEKTVERRTPKQGQEIVGKRQNSRGEIVYVVKATEDELLNKEAALVSKTLRGHVLRILPGDLLDEAMETVARTIRSADAADPNMARKRLADAFAAVGVMPADLATYLGHGLEAMSPGELDDLRAIYAAINEGETSWREIMAQHGKESGETGTKTDALKAKLKAKATGEQPANSNS